MPDFSLSSTWLIPSPIESVWSCLICPEAWPDWWKYVETVENISPRVATFPNNKRRIYWKTRLPYRLITELTVTRAIECRYLAVTVQGDLIGYGRCRVTDNAGSTRLEFDWHVATCKPWMNRFGFICRPLFEWNHRQVMKAGELGLTRHLMTLKQTAIT